MLPFILLAAGLVLILMEFFLPGGIVGTVGTLLVISSIVVYATESESLLAIAIFTVVALGMVAVLIKFALWRIKHGPQEHSVYLRTDQEGYIASVYDEDMVGSEGTAATDLKPAGHVVIEGKKVQAVSKMGYIYKGTPVLVVGGNGAHLIVKSKERNQS